MQVLHIITDFNDGGAQAVLYRFITADPKNEHQVISLMGKGWYGDRLSALGIPVHSLDMPKSKLTLDGIQKLYRLIRQINPETIQTWMYHSDFIGTIVGRSQYQSRPSKNLALDAADRAGLWHLIRYPAQNYQLLSRGGQSSYRVGLSAAKNSRGSQWL
jgi:hypothetical protein